MLARAFGVGLVACLTWAGTAHAEPTAVDKSAAETLFDEARRLMSENKYEQACPKLVDSNRLDPGVGTLLNLGRCYKSLGKTASAWSTFREAAAMARSNGQVDREELARSEAAALEPSLIRLVVEVPPEVAAQKPEIVRDGTPVPASLWGLPTPVDPGTHIVEARAPGKRGARLEVAPSAAGSTVKTVIPLLEDDPSAGAAAAAPAAAVAATPQPAQPLPAQPPPQSAPGTASADSGSSGGSGLRTTGFVVGGIGVAAAATGAVFLLLGKNENDKALELCQGGVQGNICDTETDVINHDRHVEAAKTNFTIGYVGLGVGAAAITTGVILIAVGGSRSSQAAVNSERKPSFAFAPRLGGGELGLDLSGRF